MISKGSGTGVLLLSPFFKYTFIIIPYSIDLTLFLGYNIEVICKKEKKMNRYRWNSLFLLVLSVFGFGLSLISFLVILAILLPKNWLFGYVFLGATIITSYILLEVGRKICAKAPSRDEISRAVARGVPLFDFEERYQVIKLLTFHWAVGLLIYALYWVIV